MGFYKWIFGGLGIFENICGIWCIIMGIYVVFCLGGVGGLYIFYQVFIGVYEIIQFIDYYFGV